MPKRKRGGAAAGGKQRTTNAKPGASKSNKNAKGKDGDERVARGQRALGGSVVAVPKMKEADLPANSTVPEHSVVLHVMKNTLFVRVPLHHVPANCINFEPTSTLFHLDTLRFERKRLFLE